MIHELKASVAALLVLMGMGASPAPSDRLTPMAGRLAFISQCEFPNGTRISLIYRVRSDSYSFVIRTARGGNDLSIITPREDGTLDIDTNGGLGKIEGVSSLFEWLLSQDFRTVSSEGFEEFLARGEAGECPGQYPFSP